MGNLVIYSSRKVIPKGLSKDYLLDPEKLEEYFFDGDKEKLALVDFTLPLSVSEPVLFYPACGVDILYPLFFIEKVFPSLRSIHLIFNDIDPNLGVIKTILDDVGISFSEHQGKTSFYWKDCFVKLEFILGNVFTMELPHFDIYFERAFRIMKEQDLRYEWGIYERLNPNGILISDSGFERFYLERIKVSPDISSYGEMVVGKKKAK
ncbi:hypothetical protein HYT52_03175 [Candidatus Woesearchaeota archaeon]|nr:hypothetical protein [Candidatus Woesearchaeota archaeon]